MCRTLCLAPASLVSILPVSLPGGTSLCYGHGGQEKAQEKNQQQMLSRDPDTSRPVETCNAACSGAGERMEQETKVPCSEGFSRAQAGRRPRNGGGNGSKQRDHLFAPGKAVIGRCESQSPPLVGALPPRATNRYTSKM